MMLSTWRSLNLSRRRHCRFEAIWNGEQFSAALEEENKRKTDAGSSNQETYESLMIGREGLESDEEDSNDLDDNSRNSSTIENLASRLPVVAAIVTMTKPFRRKTQQVFEVRRVEPSIPHSHL